MDICCCKKLIFSFTESNRELGGQLIEKLRSEGLINVDRLFDGVKLVSEAYLLIFLEIIFIFMSN